MLRVLIVEDEVILAFALRQQLEARGCTVLRPVTNGRAGLESCRAEQPDMVLMDIRMPVMDGWAFRREQKEDPALADIPVVVLTGIEGEHEQDRRAPGPHRRGEQGGP